MVGGGRGQCYFLWTGQHNGYRSQMAEGRGLPSPRATPESNKLRGPKTRGKERKPGATTAHTVSTGQPAPRPRLPPCDITGSLAANSLVGGDGERSVMLHTSLLRADPLPQPVTSWAWHRVRVTMWCAGAGTHGGLPWAREAGGTRSKQKRREDTRARIPLSRTKQRHRREVQDRHEGRLPFPAPGHALPPAHGKGDTSTRSFPRNSAKRTPNRHARACTLPCSCVTFSAERPGPTPEHRTLCNHRTVAGDGGFHQQRNKEDTCWSFAVRNRGRRRWHLRVGVGWQRAGEDMATCREDSSRFLTISQHVF